MTAPDVSDIEAAVAAQVMVRPALVLDCASLAPEAFTIAEHRIVFEEASRLVALNGERADTLDVLAAVIARRGLKTSPSALFDTEVGIYGTHCDAARFRGQTDALVREHRRRQLAQSARTFAAQLAEGADPDASLEVHRAACDKAVGLRSWTTLQAEVQRWNDEHMGENPVPLEAPLATGYPSMSHVRFAPGRLVVLAGRPGSYKTTLATRIATNVAARGFGVAIHAIEPTTTELVEKIIAQGAATPVEQVSNPRGREQEQAVNESAARAFNLPIAISPGAAKLAHICAHTKRIVEAPPWPDRPIKLVVIDYLQLVDHRRSKESRRNEDLAEVTSTLVRMAIALRVTVLALSSLSRAIDSDNRKGRVKRLPNMADLGESGAIERDAAAVIILHRENRTDHEITAVVAKNRHGPETNFPLRADPKVSDVIDVKAENELALSERSDTA